MFPAQNNEPWTFESDRKLFDLLESFSQRILSRSQLILTGLDKLETALQSQETQCACVTQEMAELKNEVLISRTPFMEETPSSTVVVVDTKPPTLAPPQLPLTVHMDLFEVDPLNDRPLPFVIGSKEFYSDEFVGLRRSVTQQDDDDDNGDELANDLFLSPPTSPIQPELVGKPPEFVGGSVQPPELVNRNAQLPELDGGSVKLPELVSGRVKLLESPPLILAAAVSGVQDTTVVVVPKSMPPPPPPLPLQVKTLPPPPPPPLLEAVKFVVKSKPPPPPPPLTGGPVFDGDELFSSDFPPLAPSEKWAPSIPQELHIQDEKKVDTSVGVVVPAAAAAHVEVPPVLVSKPGRKLFDDDDDEEDVDEGLIF